MTRVVNLVASLVSDVELRLIGVKSAATPHYLRNLSKLIPLSKRRGFLDYLSAFLLITCACFASYAFFYSSMQVNQLAYKT